MVDKGKAIFQACLGVLRYVIQRLEAFRILLNFFLVAATQKGLVGGAGLLEERSPWLICVIQMSVKEVVEKSRRVLT